jgi:hypothetical protein
MVAVAAVVSSGPASAGLSLIASLTDTFTHPTAGFMDLQVTSRVYQLVNDGNPHTQTVSPPNGTAVPASYTIPPAYTGQYLYEYTVIVDPSVPLTDNAADPLVFAVDWKGYTPGYVGEIDVHNPAGTIKADWYYVGQMGDPPGPSSIPAVAGTKLTWAADPKSDPYMKTAGNWIGTFYAVHGMPPTMGTGVGWDDSTSPSSGDVLVPSPEVPSLLLLLSSGMPMLGIGYLRRRKQE